MFSRREVIGTFPGFFFVFKNKAKRFRVVLQSCIWMPEDKKFLVADKRFFSFGNEKEAEDIASKHLSWVKENMEVHVKVVKKKGKRVTQIYYPMFLQEIWVEEE